MANGFPSGDWRIFNQDKERFDGHCLRAYPSADPKMGGPLRLEPVKKDPRERWHFRDAADPWGKPVNLLVNSHEDLKGYVALATEDSQSSFVFYGPFEVYARGASSDMVQRWQTADGYLFLEGQPDLVLTPVPIENRIHLVLGKRGSNPGQQWRFEPA